MAGRPITRKRMAHLATGDCSMKDVTTYLGRSEAARLADAMWQDAEDAPAARVRLQAAEPRNKHHLDRGGPCSCGECTAGREPRPAATSADTDASHRPCGHRGPTGARCNHLVRRDETGRYQPHRGAHGAFTRDGDYVQWG